MAKFVYVAEGYEYTLRPVFHLNSTKHIRIIGCELYGARNDKYYGFWDRHNIPMNLVYQLEMRARWCYAHSAYTVGESGYMRDNEDFAPKPSK